MCHNNGELASHQLLNMGVLVIYFLDTSESYPTSEEERLIFALKYGNFPFLPMEEEHHEVN